MESLLCVHAHPDDETLWTGGVLAKFAEAGARTAVVTCTWAEGTARAGELGRALEVLGAGDPRLLGWADARTPASAPEGVPRFVDVPLDEAVGEVVARIREFRPEAVLTYDAFGGYGHEDHVYAHRVATLAAEAAGYPMLYPEAGEPWRPRALFYATAPVSFMREVWHGLFGEAESTGGPDGPSGPHGLDGSDRTEGSPLPGVPDEWIDETVDIGAWGARKWEALMAHTTEIERDGVLSLLVSLPEPLRRRLLEKEWFVSRPLSPGAPRLAR